MFEWFGMAIGRCFDNTCKALAFLLMGLLYPFFIIAFTLKIGWDKLWGDVRIIEKCPESYWDGNDRRKRARDIDEKGYQ